MTACLLKLQDPSLILAYWVSRRWGLSVQPSYLACYCERVGRIALKYAQHVRRKTLLFDRKLIYGRKIAACRVLCLWLAVYCRIRSRLLFQSTLLYWSRGFWIFIVFEYFMWNNITQSDVREIWTGRERRAIWEFSAKWLTDWDLKAVLAEFPPVVKGGGRTLWGTIIIPRWELLLWERMLIVDLAGQNKWFVGPLVTGLIRRKCDSFAWGQVRVDISVK